VASAGGLVIGDLYRDNTWATAGWLGNDLVTLVVAVSLLVAALILAMRGSQRAQLVWLAMLGYRWIECQGHHVRAGLDRHVGIRGQSRCAGRRVMRVPLAGERAVQVSCSAR